MTKHRTYIRFELFDLKWEVHLSLELYDEYTDHEIEHISCNFVEVFPTIKSIPFLTTEQKKELETEIEREVSRTDWIAEINAEIVDDLI